MKYVLLIIQLFLYQFTFSQNSIFPTSKGSILLSTNSSNSTAQKTGLSVKLIDKDEYNNFILNDEFPTEEIYFYALGFDLSYFVLNNFALNIGIGLTNASKEGKSINHKFGIGYYFNKKVPIQLNYHFRDYKFNYLNYVKSHALSVEGGI